MAAELGQRVLPEPAGAAEVLEAGLLAAKERTWLGVAQAAQGVFQVRINLNLQGEQITQTFFQ